MPIFIDVCHSVPWSDTPERSLAPCPDLDDSTYEDLLQDFPPPSLVGWQITYLLGEVYICMATLITDEAPRRDGIMEVMWYFQDICRINDRVRVLRQFPQIQWNVYERVKEDLPRADNFPDRWHCSLAKIFLRILNWFFRPQNCQKDQHKLSINSERHLTGKKGATSWKKNTTELSWTRPLERWTWVSLLEYISRTLQPT